MFLVSAVCAATFGSVRAAAPQYCVPHVNTSWGQLMLFPNFVRDFYNAKNVANAVETYITAHYIQHNSFVGQRSAATIEYLQPLFSQLDIQVLKPDSTKAKDLCTIESTISTQSLQQSSTFIDSMVAASRNTGMLSRRSQQMQRLHWHYSNSAYKSPKRR